MDVEFVFWTIMGALFVFALGLVFRVGLYCYDWYVEYRYLNRPATITAISSIEFHGSM